MSTKRGKIITTFRQRRWVEDQFQAMLEVRSQRELAAHAEQIARTGSQVIPAILSNLNTANPQLLGVLGTVATYLDREKISEALYDVAMEPDRSDRERMAAILILDRFLDEEVSEDLLNSLDNPHDVAVQSLIDMLAEASKNRLVLLEYARTLEVQPPEVVLATVEIMGQLDDQRQAIEPLRLLAQDPRPEVASSALHTLGTIRRPQSARALQTLLPTLPPDRRTIAERSLRKLRLAGVKYDRLPAPDSDWRTLISPVDGQGNQSIWFLQSNEQHCRFFSVIVNDVIGIRNAFGDENLDSSHFPQRQEVGFVHAFILPEVPTSLTLLESDFDYGRRRVLDVLSRHDDAQNPTPLEYRLLNDLLWQYDVSGVEASLRLPPPLQNSDTVLVDGAEALLMHPAFESWFVQSEKIYASAERLLLWRSLTGNEKEMLRLIEQLADSHFDAEGLARRRVQLTWMAEWLSQAGEVQTAELALAVAAGLEKCPPHEHPLLVGMVKKGLEIAMNNLRLGFDVRQHPELQ